MHHTLRFANVSCQWGEGKGFSNACFDISLQYPVVITGPSGSGKSTVARLLTRLQQPHAGDIFLDKKNLTAYHPLHLRSVVMFMQQQPCMIAGSIQDNLLLAYTFARHRKQPEPGPEILTEWLHAVRLENLNLDDDARSCSTGQQQRISLLRCLLLSPDILCLDEPTSALDAETASLIEELIAQISKKTALILITHSSYRPQAAYTHMLVDRGSITTKQVGPWNI